MIPWLSITELMSQSKKSLAALVGERMRKFPASGEINRKPSTRRTPSRSTAPTGSASSSRTGASICARRTPSRCCDSTSRAAATKR
jgi:hypothetical protein